MESDADRYAVVGNPVAHSLSPRIHSEFARQCAQNLEYEAIELPVDGFIDGVADLRRRGYRGLNVTVPFKREAWESCDQLSERAATAGAVNTLIFDEDGGVHGDNTDGIGLVRDLVDNLQIKIEGSELLILGAGGAVRGVLEPLLAQSPAGLTIVNRNLDRAAGLSRDFRSFGKIDVLAYTQLSNQKYDLIINATAAGLSQQLPPIPASLLDPATVCYDMMYNVKEPTRFVEWSTSQGVRNSFDGLGMLVEQAAEAFSLWRGIRPQTGELMRTLRIA